MKWRVVGLCWALVVAWLLVSSLRSDRGFEIGSQSSHPEVRDKVTEEVRVASGRTRRDRSGDASEDEGRTSEDVDEVRPVTTAMKRSVEAGKVKHCALSQHAQDTNLAAKLLSICNQCTPQHGMNKPAFCRKATHPLRVRHDFSLPLLSEEALKEQGVPAAPTVLSIIYCAIGSRFYGPGGQSYVWESIRQWRAFNSPSRSAVLLVVSTSSLKDPGVVANATAYHVELVDEQTLRTPEWETYLKVFYIQGYMHPGGSRTTGNKKFNQHVSERFFAVHALMAKRSLTHVLHMENDMMLYAPWESLVGGIRRCGHRLATTSPHTKGFIPGVVYIRDAAAMHHLVSFINDILSCGKAFGSALQKGYANDMTYLMNYYQFYGSAFMGELPAWEHAPGENCIADFDAANGGKLMWDAASFGQWYSFIPPGKSQPPKHIRQAVKGRFVDATPPPLMTWQTDDEGRKVPYWKGYRMVSLHVHAKNLEQFRSR